MNHGSTTDPQPRPDPADDRTRPAPDTPPTWAEKRGKEPAGRIGEFELLSELGCGAFGRVFLARQVSLDRRVALKVTAGRGSGQGEGLALAGLEHDHIVKVFSEFTDPDSGSHCLCLQYVAGPDLSSVISRLHAGATPPASGRAVLDVIDSLARPDGTFDPAALRDREALAADDFPQAVCRLGGRLAEALAFAHAKKVLHCDIKPANILVNPYGRPMLADFNVSFDPAHRNPDDTALGGTAAYMAPEYRLACREGATSWVDGRCDVFSLGVVLHELATGKRPGFAGPDPLAAVPRELAAVIRRCLDPDPTRRYQTAGELAEALSGAWHLLAARRLLPRPGRFGRWVAAHPTLALALAALLPHVVGSVVNIAYNTVQIRLTDPQKTAFLVVTLLYNLVVYPLCGGTGIVLARRVAARFRDLPRADGPAADDLRRRACRFGRQVAVLGLLGWFPGGVLFPLGIDALAGGVERDVYAHYFISFTLAGLVGVVFSYLGVQYVVLRALFPRLGNPDTFRPGAMAAEVRPLVAPAGSFLVLACVVPLTGAVLLMTLAPVEFTHAFRALVAGLIVLGMAGVGLAERLTRQLTRLAAAWGVGESDADCPAGAGPPGWDDVRLSGVVRRYLGS